MGVVYRAYDARLERVVALKVLRDAAPIDVARFQVEARAVARLKHPDIVSVHEVGRFEDTWYLALDLIEGESLQARLDRQGPMPAIEAVRLVERIARAVHAAHEANVLHRDLKPGNILVTREGDPRLVDFGLAKVTDDQRRLSSVGDVLGTPAFMAPEQKRGEVDAVGVPADVYGLGGTLLNLLTGLTPGGDTRHVYRVVRDRRLAEICACALDPSPGARYRSARAMADELRRYMDGGRDVRDLVPLGSRSLRAATALLVGGALIAAFAVASLGAAPGPSSTTDTKSAGELGDEDAEHLTDPHGDLDVFDPARRGRRSGRRPRVAKAERPVPPTRDGRAPPPADGARVRAEPGSAGRTAAPRSRSAHPLLRWGLELAAEAGRGGGSAKASLGHGYGLIAWFRGPQPEDEDDEQPESVEVAQELAPAAASDLELELGNAPVEGSLQIGEADGVAADPTLEELDLEEPDDDPDVDEVFGDYRDLLNPSRAGGYTWSSYYQANTRTDGYVSALARSGPGELLVAHAPGQIDRIQGGKAMAQATFTAPIRSIASGDPGVVAAAGGKVYQRAADGTWTSSLDPSAPTVHVAALDDDLYAFAGGSGDAKVYRRKDADGAWEETARLTGVVPTVTAALDDDELWVSGPAAQAGAKARVYRGEKETWTEVSLLGGRIRSDERQDVTAMLAIGGRLFVAVTTRNAAGDAVEGAVYGLDKGKLKPIGRLRADAILSLAYSDGTLYLGTGTGRLLFVQRAGAEPGSGGKKKKTPRLKLKLADEAGLPLNGGVHTILPAGDGALLVGVRGPYGAEVLLRTPKP